MKRAQMAAGWIVLPSRFTSPKIHYNAVSPLTVYPHIQPDHILVIIFYTITDLLLIISTSSIQPFINATRLSLLISPL